jgi:hypothetical protein
MWLYRLLKPETRNLLNNAAEADVTGSIKLANSRRPA